HDTFEIEDGLFLRQLRGFQRGANPATFVDGLYNPQARRPVLFLLKSDRWRGRRELEAFKSVVELVVAGGTELGNGDGAGLHDHAISGFQIALAFENRAVLFQRQVDALPERERPRKPSLRGAVRFRRAKTADGEQCGDEEAALPHKRRGAFKVAPSSVNDFTWSPSRGGPCPLRPSE